MIDPAIGAMLAGAFALLFVSAALNKLRSLQRFAEVFRAYRLLPGGVARLSWLVPALELTVGVGLLARRSRGRERGGRGAAGSLRCCDRDQSAARPSRSGLRLRRPARATTDCRLDGVAQSP